MTRLYIESQFGGKEVVSSSEAVEMMSDERYSDWLDNNKNDVAGKIERDMGEHINREDDDEDEEEDEDDEDDEDEDDEDDEEDEDDEDDEVGNKPRDADQVGERVGGDL